MSAASVIQPTKATSLNCDEILRVANRDATAVYRDLNEYQITLALLPDGWHVDYNLTKPLVAGGGPHYVIDPMTAQIISKRYEQ